MENMGWRGKPESVNHYTGSLTGKISAGFQTAPEGFHYAGWKGNGTGTEFYKEASKKR